MKNNSKQSYLPPLNTKGNNNLINSTLIRRNRSKNNSKSPSKFSSDCKTRVIEPAKNYDVISFARAMNPNLGSKVKELFQVEKKAAIEAAESGVYVSWRCPNQKWDCQRVASSSKCFCGHSLQQHGPIKDSGSRTLCKFPNCSCKHFAWIPSKPEEIGEFWLRRRKNFNENEWRAKCKCKHSHEEHDANGSHKCAKCSCPCFQSNFLCAACDRKWEEHETFFESVSERRQNGLATGPDFLPFSGIPSLRNMVLTGKDDGDVSYIKLQSKLTATTVRSKSERCC